MQMTSIEIERKWLLHSLPDLTGFTGEKLIQGYIAIAVDGTEVRLRQKGNKYFQTVKTEGDVIRNEFEIELSKAQYDRLWPATEGRRLEKIRYELQQDTFIIEIDVYKGEHAGLLVAEVEFPSTNTSDLFSPPEWFGLEVTSDKRYKNKNLATKGLRQGPKQDNIGDYK